MIRSIDNEESWHFIVVFLMDKVLYYTKVRGLSYEVETAVKTQGRKNKVLVVYFKSSIPYVIIRHSNTPTMLTITISVVLLTDNWSLWSVLCEQSKDYIQASEVIWEVIYVTLSRREVAYKLQMPTWVSWTKKEVYSCHRLHLRGNLHVGCDCAICDHGTGR